MKNIVAFLFTLLSINQSNAQRWNSAFVGKPESRALHASYVAKAIQNAWENELSLKGNKEMLLDEIVFGQDSELKEIKSIENNKSLMSNIEEIEEILGIKEEVKIDPAKKKKVEIITEVFPVKAIQTIEKEPSNAIRTEIKVTLENTISKPLSVEKIANKKTLLTIDNNDDVEADSVYLVPQVSPIFPGGQDEMRNFFAKNVIMPESNGKSVKGKVFIRFLVRKNGELSKIYLVKGLTETCNKEAIRIIKKMPPWIPARQKGEEVSSWYILPVYFEIE